MGLLSSRTFRQIATGALTGIEEKRNDMRDRIDTYREKAVNKKNEIQKKYNAYYDEEKENINTFKTVATAAGDDYLPALNSFVGTDPSRLSIFDRMNANEIRTELDKYKDAAPADTGFIQSRQERLKLKESELNQNLQDQVGLFKGTSTLFTRDIEDRGVKDIQAEAGTLESQRLKTDFTAGAGIGLKTSLKLSEVQNNFSIYDNYYMDKLDALGNKTGERMINPQFADNVAQIDKQADTLIDNGFGGNRTQAIAEIVEIMNNPSYRGDALQFLNNAVDGSPVLEDTEEAFSAAIENRDITTMENLIKDLENRNRPDEVKLYKDRLEQFKEDEANLSAEEFTKRALEEADDTESDKIIDFQLDKPKFKQEYKDILSFSEYNSLSEDKVRVIYKLIEEGKYSKPKKEEPKQEERKSLSTEGLSESDAAVVDKINTALGLS